MLINPACATLVTCPWYGFQYDVRTGRAPAPFTETIPTDDLRRVGARVLIDPVPKPPGAPTEPLPLPREGT